MRSYSSTNYGSFAKWAGWLFKLLFAVAIVVFIYTFKWEKPPQAPEKKAPQGSGGTEPKEDFSKVYFLGSTNISVGGQIAEILSEASKKRGFRVVGIIHYHTPGNLESEQLADRLNSVALKYGSQVAVIRVDIVAMPNVVAEEKITSATKVLMLVESKRLFEFQGLWALKDIELKVEEILRGLKRVGKDWLPEVKGMQRPASGQSPPVKPVEP